jgi:hypothetical protein
MHFGRGAKNLPDLVMRFLGFEPTLYAEGGEVLRLLSSRFVGRKTALRTTA